MLKADNVPVRWGLYFSVGGSILVGKIEKIYIDNIVNWVNQRRPN